MRTKKTASKLFTGKLTSIKGYLIFSALSVASLSWLVMQPSWLALLSLVLVWFRLYRSKQLILLVSCFLASFFFGGYFLWQLGQTEAGQLLGEERRQSWLLIDPNTLVSDGQLLTFEGRDRETNELFALRYQFQTLEEKEQVEKQDSYFEWQGEYALEVPNGQRNLNGFDYRQSLLERGIYRQGQVLTIGQRKRVPVWRPTQLIKVWRRRLSLHIDRVFSDITASYMKSLFLGVKDITFRNQQDIWRQIGILHFFSISGMHVYFFVGHFKQLCLRLGLTKESVFWLELLFLFVYLFLAGFSTSVGRSVVFIGLRSLNKHFNGYFSELDCWSGTLLISLVLNPYVLLQASGQLSFGLSFYIIYLRGIVGKLPPLLFQLAFSLSLSILAIPIMSANFYEWHFLGIGLTFLLMPIFNYVIMPVLTVLLGMSVFGQLSFFELVEGGISAFQKFLGILSAERTLNVVTGQLAPVVVICCLALSLYWLHIGHKGKFLRWGILVVIVVLPSLSKYGDFHGMVAIVDVGQGDSIFIQRPFRQEGILIDTGGNLAFNQEGWQQRERQTSQANYTLIPFLKSRGVKTLKQVFITHPHADHFGDLQELSQQVAIEALYYPKGADKQKNFQIVLQELAKNSAIRSVTPGESWQNRDYRLDVLYPESEGEGGNDDSLILGVNLKGQRMLLTGDLEEAGERRLLARYPQLSADILKVGHHGSRTSSTEAFLAQLGADTAIISCGSNNRFGHPHEETIARLDESKMRIYRTDQDGMVYYQWSLWDKKLSDIQTIKKSH